MKPQEDLTSEELITKTIKNLASHRMEGFFLKNREELFPLLETLLLEGCSVGSGDSETLENLGVFDFLRAGNYTFYDKHLPELSSNDKRNIYLKTFGADVFFTSCNAVSAEGHLVNIDGNGSRVAPMVYGPRKVIVVVGTNKIRNTLEDAQLRVRQIAAPLDAKRLGKTTPCATLGKCIDCHHPDRICNSFLVLSNQFDRDRIKVIILNEELGF